MRFKSIEQKNNALEYTSVMNRIAISLIAFTFLLNILFVLAIILETFVLELNVIDEGSFVHTLLQCTLESIAYTLSFILPAFLFYLLSKNRHARRINFSFKLPGKIWLYMLVALALTRVASYLNSILVDWLTSPIYEDIPKVAMEPYELALALITGALVPAVSEEILFRGVIAENIKPYGKGVALIVSAVLFGFMHQNPNQLLYTAVAGLTLAYIYLKTESLYGCMIFHFLNNAQATVSEYIYNTLSDESYYIFETVSMVLIVGGGAIALLILILTQKSNSREEYCYFGVDKTESIDSAEKRINEVDALKGFFCIANIFFMVISALMMIYIALIA